MLRVMITHAKNELRNFDLLYVLPEFDVVGMSRPTYKGDFRKNEDGTYKVMGLPSTVKFYEPTPVWLSSNDRDYDLPPAQLLRERFYSQCPPSWSNATKEGKMRGYLKDGVCYTDHTGGFGWNSIVTCGNVLYPTGKTIRRGLDGILYYEIIQLVADTYSRMSDQLEEYPFLETWATTSNRLNGDERGRGWFPHCGDTRDNSVPALLFGKVETNWVLGSRVRMLSRAEPIPQLYYP